jgi:hypothetical protein
MFVKGWKQRERARKRPAERGCKLKFPERGTAGKCRIARRCESEARRRKKEGRGGKEAAREGLEGSRTCERKSVARAVGVPERRRKIRVVCEADVTLIAA